MMNILSGDLKIGVNKYMFQQSRVFFAEVAEAPQAAATQTQRAGKII